MGSGVIKAQISSRTPCTAGRSAAEADEAIAAKHAKAKEIVRKTFPGICFTPSLLVSRKVIPPPRGFRFGRSLLICINDGRGNRLVGSGSFSEVRRRGKDVRCNLRSRHRLTTRSGPFRAINGHRGFDTQTKSPRNGLQFQHRAEISATTGVPQLKR